MRSARTARTAARKRLPSRPRAAASPPRARGRIPPTAEEHDASRRRPGPASAAAESIRSIASAKRRGDTHSASQPSPSWPVRTSAASDRPPTRIGIGGAGAGRIAPRRLKNRPRKSTSWPSMNRRRQRSASVVRAPRSRGSIPHSSSSPGSSPPTPMPNVNLPGASSAIVASCRATTAGWRRASRYTPVCTDKHRVGGQERGRLDQAIGAVAIGEADVVADGQVIDAGCYGVLGELVQAAGPRAEVVLAQDDPDPDGVDSHGPVRAPTPRPRALRWRSRLPAIRTRARTRDRRHTRG